MKLVYADNNATTRVNDEVLEEMLPYFKEYYGNPSSVHTFGRQVAGKIDIARERVANILGPIHLKSYSQVVELKVITMPYTAHWRQIQKKDTLSPRKLNIRQF